MTSNTIATAVLAVAGTLVLCFAIGGLMMVVAGSVPMLHRCAGGVLFLACSVAGVTLLQAAAL